MTLPVPRRISQLVSPSNTGSNNRQQQSVSYMEAFQQLGSPSILGESSSQFRMQLNQLPQGIAGLLAPLAELLVGRKVFVLCCCGRAGSHSASRLFQPIPQLDVFHAVNKELFVEPTNFAQQFSTRRHVPRMVVGKIHGLVAGDAVRIKDSLIPEIAEKWIVRFLPRRHHSTDDRGARRAAHDTSGDFQ